MDRYFYGFRVGHYYRNHGKHVHSRPEHAGMIIRVVAERDKGSIYSQSVVVWSPTRDQLVGGGFWATEPNFYDEISEEEVTIYQMQPKEV